MSSSPAINPGDTWTLIPTAGLGTGLGAIPAGAQVVIEDVLPPFSAGVCWTDENTVTATYAFQEQTMDANGNATSVPSSRVLAYPQSDFLLLFAPPGGSG